MNMKTAINRYAANTGSINTALNFRINETNI